MQILKVEHTRWNDADHTSMDCIVTTKEHGAIEFTAVAGDVYGHGIFDRALAGDFGAIAPYTPRNQTPQEIRAEKRRERTATVQALTVTTTSGKTFNSDEDSQNRMTRAVVVAGITGQTQCTWVLANDTPTTVTLAELQEALALSVQAMGAVWPAPYQE